MNAIETRVVSDPGIHALGHDEAASRLAIQFKRRGAPGSLYYYENVPREEYVRLASAVDLYAYFAANIRNNPVKFPYQKIK